MPVSRRRLFGLLAAASAASALGTAPASAAAAPPRGLVFVASNDAAGNELWVYARQRDGTLGLLAQLPTGELGSGAGLGSQGAVTLSEDGRFVFVVNAGSDSVSAFSIGDDGSVALASTAPSGGLHPISVTEKNGQLVVLNDGGSGNVAGLRNDDGQLSAVAGSARPLSVAGGAAPAQVGFSDDGRSVVVTEKATNRVTSYAVQGDGSLSAPQSIASPGTTPFGFAFNRRNRLVVTEAAGGASGASTVSSFRFGTDAAMPVVVSPAVPDGQSAACWVAIAPNGRWAYVANTGSSNVSRYAISPGGQIELLEPAAGDTGAGSAPADTAVGRGGRELFVRNGVTATISAFRIAADGSLRALAGATGLPAHAVGLAAQ